MKLQQMRDLKAGQFVLISSMLYAGNRRRAKVIEIRNRQAVVEYEDGKRSLKSFQNLNFIPEGGP